MRHQTISSALPPVERAIEQPDSEKERERQYVEYVEAGEGVGV